MTTIDSRYEGALNCLPAQIPSRCQITPRLA
jgi:hypothetical protein